MSGKRPIRVENISEDEMRELMWFCRGYRRKKREADELLTLRVSTPRPEKLPDGSGAFLPRGKGGVPRSPVDAVARKREKYLRDVRMIDRAARLAAAEYADAGNREKHLQYLLTQVVTGERTATWAICRCTVGRNRFYAMRRLFFCILAGLRE